MSRLTKKHRLLELYVAKENVPQHIAFDKLGKLEDILEEYGIEDLTDLKIALDYYYHRYDGGVYTERVGNDE